MRGTPPPPGRSGSGANWGRDRQPNPNDPDRTIAGGAPYRGGPMAPGPQPGQTIARRGPMPPGPPPPGATIARGNLTGSNPNRSITPSRPQPGGSYVGPLAPDGTMRSRAVSAVSRAIAPQESLFSGNLRRLWVSEIASTAGDVILGTGVVIWYLQLTLAFPPVALLLLAFSVPAAIVGLFAGSLAARKDPRRALFGLGVLRVLLALVFVAMYFHTIPQLMLALAFGLSLSSSMRVALRRAAVARGVPLRARGTLASGDQLAAGILSVAGPALSMLLYILNGERIFTIAVGASLCYILALTGESQAEPLPDKILYQRPAGDERVENVWEGDEDEAEDSRVLKAEAQAQVWELAAPPTPAAAFADVNAGLRIAGESSHARAAFWALTGLALAGGVLSVAEPFYLWHVLGQPPFMLGLLFTATGLGTAIASAIVVEARSFGRIFLSAGLALSGVGLIALPRMTDVAHALGAVAIIGAANVFAIRGGQMVLLRHFIPVGQRAVAASIAAVTGLMAPLGMMAGYLLMAGIGSAVKPIGLENALIISGACVVICGVITALQMLLPNRMAPVETVEDIAAGMEGEEADWDDEYDDEDEDDEDSRRYPRARGGRYDDSDRYSTYSAAYPAYSDEYETPRGRSRYDDDDDDDRSPRQRYPRR